jgi:hypothetical protein
VPEISTGHHNQSLLPSYQGWTFARCGLAGIFLDGVHVKSNLIGNRFIVFDFLGMSSMVCALVALCVGCFCREPLAIVASVLIVALNWMSFGHIARRTENSEGIGVA